MASKALNTANLEALGITRLAELLIEISEGNAPVKRRLRLELASTDSPTAVADQIRKRIATIARSRSFIDWHNRKSLVDDLQAQRRAIVDQVAWRLPAEGLELMWRFLELAESVFARCDDSYRHRNLIERCWSRLRERFRVSFRRRNPKPLRQTAAAVGVFAGPKFRGEAFVPG